MNRIDKTLKEKDNILSIYFTAGYPHLKSTNEIEIESHRFEYCFVKLIMSSLTYQIIEN